MSWSSARRVGGDEQSRREDARREEIGTGNGRVHQIAKQRKRRKAESLGDYRRRRKGAALTRGWRVSRMAGTCW